MTTSDHGRLLGRGRLITPVVAWLAHVYTRHRAWIVQDVLLPFAITRFCLLLVGWFASHFPINPDYPHTWAQEHGWVYSPYWFIDMWGRWDTGWYLNIIQRGYALGGDVHSVQSNVAFFPLYPYLVKLLALLIPFDWTRESVLLLGAVVSNVSLVVMLILLYRLIVLLLDNGEIARRAVLYVLVFPTSIFLSSFYTESTFLVLAVAAFFAAHKRNWALAGICGMLLGLTRPVGILIMAPLLWMYMESVAWKLPKIRLDILWLGFTPIGLLLFLAYIYQETGVFLAPFANHEAWGRELASPIRALLAPADFTPYLTPITQVLTVLFLAGAVASLRWLPSLSYGLYALLMIMPTLIHGTLLSNERLYLPAFPVFIVFAIVGKRLPLHQSLAAAFFTLQILFMFAWSRFYWIG